MTQSGELNRSGVSQTAGPASATVGQSGIFNNSQIDQNATGASATVDQAADNTEPTFFPTNDSIITQNADATAGVTQRGQNNVSTIDQRAGADGANATVNQTGSQGASSALNSATITQETAGANAGIMQNGGGNTSTITQTGTAGRFGASATNSQLGDDNTSDYHADRGWPGASQPRWRVFRYHGPELR